MAHPVLQNASARRLFLDRHLLLRPKAGSGKGADLAELLTGLGFVQVDSVNTLARAHDLILWSRRGQYRPKALEYAVARDRTGFEHWTHDAAVVPMRFYPMWRLKFERDEIHMKRRWVDWRREGWQKELNTVLQRISDYGATCSRDVGEGEPKGTSGWWDWHPSKTALEYLWRSGRLAICHRQGFRKFYDLRERVIPSEHLETHLSDEEIIDWSMSAALDRLGFATSGELAAFFAIATAAEAKAWVAQALAEGRVIEADVEMSDGSARRCVTTEAILETATALPNPSQRIRLLSPFDPALRDRARAERLFGYQYRIEIFVPAAKRNYGYYVFPMLQGDRMIGRIDAKRAGGKLNVTAFWPEAGVRMGHGRLNGLRAELERTARFAGLQDLSFEENWLRNGA